MLLIPTVTALQTLWRYVTHMLDLMTLYTTKRKQYVCWSDQTIKGSVLHKGRYSRRIGLVNEELIIVEGFRYLGHVMTADCRDDKDIKNQFMKQYAGQEVLICTCGGKNSIVQEK